MDQPPLSTPENQAVTHKLTAGDWVMLPISFLLTPLVSTPLCVYNFARGRKRLGWLYLGVLILQIGLLVGLRLMLNRYAAFV